MSSAGIQSWTYTAADNTTVNGINIAENCPAANINNAIRQVMSSVMQEIAYQGADVSASVSLSLAGVDYRYMAITGSASIIHAGTGRAGLHRELVWNSPSTVVNSANIINDGGRNIVTATNDVSLFLSQGSGAWRALHFPANGVPAVYNQSITASATITDSMLLRNASGAKLVSVADIQNGIQNTIAENLIINGGMQVNQRVVTTGAADDTYTHDRWYALTQTSTITIAQQTDQEDGTPFNIRLTQAQVSAQRMGLAQIVESSNCRQARGQAVAFNARVRCSSSQAIRYAILEWTGTADSVTSDVVLDWTSASYTAGGFFLGSNLTVTAVGATTPAANTWTTLSVLTGTCGSSVNNLILFIWTEGTAANGVTLDISRAQCCLGAVLPTFSWPVFPRVLEQCQRYYRKSFPPATAPAQSASTVGAIRGPQVVGASTANNGGLLVDFSVQMRTSPTVVTFNPDAANAQARNTITGTDCSSTSTGSKEHSLSILFVSPSGSAAGNNIAVHYTADAEL